MPDYRTISEARLKYNPYAARSKSLAGKITSAEGEKKEKVEQLGWYVQFDVDKESAALNNLTRKAESIEKAFTANSIELAEERLLVESLRRAAKPGWDPRYWFSPERTSKIRELNTHEETLTQLSSKSAQLQEEQRRIKHLSGKQRTDLDRYRSFRSLDAEATVRALTFQLENLNRELEQLRPLMQQVDEQLREPLSRLTGLEQQQKEIERDIDQAEILDQRLSRASSSYERKSIHDECSRIFGCSSPRKVISEKKRQLELICRDIGKLQSRLESISQRATRIIKSLVIDGNNLCYQYRNFIGLAALLVLAKRLSPSYSVLIVFDASIRSLLRMSDKDIATRLGGLVKIHVVASKKSADETLLDSANAPHTYGLYSV